MEDILQDDDESDSEDAIGKIEKQILKKPREDDSSSSSDDSMTGEYPRGFKKLQETSEKTILDEDLYESSLDESPSIKFRRGEELDSELDIGQESNSEGSDEPVDEVDDGEWNMIGAAIEREFLSNN